MRVKKYADTDFLCGSARVRACENTLIGRERCARMLEAKTPADCISVLSECGITVINRSRAEDDGAPPQPDFDATADAYVAESFDFVQSLLPDSTLLRYMRYPYDCNNIKALLKSGIMGADASELMSRAGSVSPDAAAAAFANDDWSVFAPHMAKAASGVSAVYSKNGDPKAIDIPLDNACFADMLEAAPAGLLRSFTVMRADMQNIITTLRVIMLGDIPTAPAMLASALIPGGSLPHSDLLKALDGGRDKLCELIRFGSYGAMVPAMESSVSFSSLEKAADNIYISEVSKIRFIPFGLPVLFAYLTGVEYGIRNARIIYNSKVAGLPYEAVRARVRESYV